MDGWNGQAALVCLMILYDFAVRRSCCYCILGMGMVRVIRDTSNCPSGFLVFCLVGFGIWVLFRAWGTLGFLIYCCFCSYVTIIIIIIAIAIIVLGSGLWEFVCLFGCLIPLFFFFFFPFFFFFFFFLFGDRGLSIYLFGMGGGDGW